MFLSFTRVKCRWRLKPFFSSATFSTPTIPLMLICLRFSWSVRGVAMLLVGQVRFSCCGSRLEVKLRAKVASVFHAAVSSLSRVSLVRAGGGCFLCWAAGKVAQREYRVKVKGQPHQVSTAKWSTTACVEKRYDPSPLWENISIHYLCQIPHPSVS